MISTRLSLRYGPDAALRELHRLPPPPVRTLAGGDLALVRLHGLAQDATVRGEMDQRMVRLLSGWAQTGRSWAWLARSDGASLSVVIGSTDPGFHQTLAGALPAPRLEPLDASTALASTFSGLPGRAILTGHPAEMGLQLVDLFRGLRGHPWAWLVLAEPVDAAAARAEAEFLVFEESEVRAEFLRPGTIEAVGNPPAERLARALTARREHRLACAEAGGWVLSAMLLAEDAATLREAVALANGGLASSNTDLPGARFHAPGAATETPCTLLTSAEAARLIRLPTEDLPGFTWRAAPRFAVSSPAMCDAHALAVGLMLDRGEETNHWFALLLNDLCRHVAITGQTGAGKSTTLRALLRRLWLEHRLPFLVIDAGLNPSHRVLASQLPAGTVRVFTPGDDTTAPLAFHLLAIPEGAPVQRHLDGLVALLSSVFGLPEPMPRVLATALQRLYLAHGWDPSSNRRGTLPRLAELATAVELVVAENGWQGELRSTLKAGLLIRLHALTFGAKATLFDAPSPVAIASLLAAPTIMEPTNLGDDDQALFAGLLLLHLEGHWIAAGPARGAVRHVAVIEEAHRILRRAPEQAQPGEANARGHFVARFSQFLAESRSLGAAWIFSDQRPSNLAPEILANTNLKLAHRLVAEEDTRAMAACMGLDETQRRALINLARGQCLAHAEGCTTAAHLRIPRAPCEDCEAPANEALRRPAEAGPGDPCPGCGHAACPDRHRLGLVGVARFHAALDSGVDGLWRLGLAEVARLVPPGAAPGAAWCALLGAMERMGLSPEAIRNLRRLLVSFHATP